MISFHSSFYFFDPLCRRRHACGNKNCRQKPQKLRRSTRLFFSARLSYKLYHTDSNVACTTTRQGTPGRTTARYATPGRTRHATPRQAADDIVFRIFAVIRTVRIVQTVKVCATVALPPYCSWISVYPILHVSIQLTPLKAFISSHDVVGNVSMR